MVDINEIQKQLDNTQVNLVKAKENLLGKKGFSEKEVAERLEKEIQMLCARRTSRSENV